MNTQKKIIQRGRPVGTSKVSQPLTDKEVKALFGACYGKHGLRNRCIIALGLYSGMRIGTSLGLDIQQILNGEGRCAGSVCVSKHNEKSGRTHTYYIAEQGRRYINDYLETMPSSGLLFPSPKTGNKMSSSSGSRLVSNLLKDAGILNQSSHCCRKSYAHRLYTKHCIGLAELSKLLNHSTPTQSLAYIGNLQPQIEQAMKLLKY